MSDPRYHDDSEYFADYRAAVFHAELKPIIEANYAARMAGELPDEMFWADSLAMGWGYFVETPVGMRLEVCGVN